MTKPLALIVEDHEDHTIIFDNALVMAGFATEIIKDGAVAQKRLGEVVPDVVILDLHIPHVPGTVLLEQIRDDERLAGTQVVVVTADEALGRELSETVDLLLIKPVSFSQLRALAERLRSSD